MLLMLPQVVAPLATMDRKIENSQIIVSIVSVIGALVTLAVVTGLAFWLVHSITRPLKAMRLVATEIAQSSTGAVAPGLHNDVQGGQDEIGEFVQEFKTMLSGLSATNAKATTVSATLVKNPYFRPAQRPWSFGPDMVREFEDPLDANPPQSAHPGAGVGAGAGAGAGSGASAGAGAGVDDVDVVCDDVERGNDSDDGGGSQGGSAAGDGSAESQSQVDGGGDAGRGDVVQAAPAPQPSAPPA